MSLNLFGLVFVSLLLLPSWQSHASEHPDAADSVRSDLKSISYQQAMADLDSMISFIGKVHYHPWMHISEADFLRSVDSLRKSFKSEISSAEFILGLYRITALLGDAHTMPVLVQPGLVPHLRKELFLPLPFVFHNGSLYTPYDSGNVLPGGSRLVSVNGHNVDSLLKEHTKLFGGELSFSQEISTRLFSYFLFLSGVRPPFRIGFSESGKAERSITLDSAVTFKNALIPQLPSLTRSYEFQIIGDKLGLISLNAMSGNLDHWGGFLDSVFNEMRIRKISALAVDIRNNSGGNSWFGNYLLAYLTDKKFSMSGGRCWKVSDEYKEHLKSSGNPNAEYHSKTTGTVWCFDHCAPKDNPVISDYKYDGKVFLITGPYTFSSANMLADAFKNFSLGTIIGEPTGERTNDFGEAMQFTLKNSGVVIQVSTSFDYGADCNKQSTNVVVPDIILQPSLEDKLNHRDPVIQHLLK